MTNSCPVNWCHYIDTNHLYEKEFSKLINQIFNAIKNNKVLTIFYKKDEENSYTYTVHPHLLKEFNGRWFVFGFCEEFEAIPNFHLRLDRISKITVSEKAYNSIKFRKKDYKTYFETRVGVSDGTTKDIENIEYSIKLKFNKRYYEYFLTKPISQILKSDFVNNNEFVIVKFKSFINNELVSLILSYKSNVEVLEPDGLRQIVKKEVNKLFDFYNQT